MNDAPEGSPEAVIVIVWLGSSVALTVKLTEVCSFPDKPDGAVMVGGGFDDDATLTISCGGCAPSLEEKWDPSDDGDVTLKLTTPLAVTTCVMSTSYHVLAETGPSEKNIAGLAAGALFQVTLVSVQFDGAV